MLNDKRPAFLGKRRCEQVTKKPSRSAYIVTRRCVYYYHRNKAASVQLPSARRLPICLFVGALARVSLACATFWTLCMRTIQRCRRNSNARTPQTRFHCFRLVYGHFLRFNSSLECTRTRPTFAIAAEPTGNSV